MKKLYLSLIVLCILQLQTYAQVKHIHGSLEGQGGATTGGQVPFWMRSNQYGSIPLSGISASFIGSLHRDYDSTSTRLTDWGASFEGRANVGSHAAFILIEGYGKVRAGIFELKAGRAKEVMGLVDTTLSSGAFAISGNALGIPKVQLAIPEFYTLPIFGKLFAFKGSFAHGWLGRLPIGSFSLVDQAETYFHQKSLYGRFGKPGWRLKLYGGFNHQVFWGNSKSFYGDRFTLSPWQEYQHVLFGTAYGGGRAFGGINIERSKIGNHLGSIDVGLEYDFENIRLLAYRQNFYDVGALSRLANILDGLHGLSLVNKRYGYSKLYSNPKWQWKRLLFEFLYTKNQAGLPSSPRTNSGDEDYYNNYIYPKGWSYNRLGLGTPFIVPKVYAREGLPSNPSDYFISNRVLAFHIGLEGAVHSWNFTGKISYSRNYGTYATSIYGKSTGSRFHRPRYGTFEEVGQLSTYLEGQKELKNGFKFGCIAALDIGKLYNNAGCVIFKVSKSL